MSNIYYDPNKLPKALEYFYNLVDLQGGSDEYWKNYRIIEKDLNNYENLKQIINEEFKGLTCAMGENLDFSDEEDVKHYDCLKAKAEILEKIIRHIERY